MGRSFACLWDMQLKYPGLFLIVKKYRTELTLGIKTDTEDIYGTIIKKFSIIPTEEEIRRLC